MDLVAIEFPASGISLPGEPLELFNALFRVVSTGQLVQIITNQLIHAGSEGLCFFAGARNGLGVNGKSDIHKHIILVHILCVNDTFEGGASQHM